MVKKPVPHAAFQRELHSRISEFRAVVRALTDWSPREVDAGTLRSVVLVLEELFSNIVIHGYQGHADGWILVQAEVQDDILRITLTDHAPPFNPVLVPEPDIGLDVHERKIGGMGLLLVRRLADSLDYHWREEGSGPGRNEVSFTKRLRAPGDSG